MALVRALARQIGKGIKGIKAEEASTEGERARERGREKLLRV